MKGGVRLQAATMFTKSLGHEALEELFVKYQDMPNINHFDFLLKPYYVPGQEKQLLLMRFRKNYDEDPSISFGKIIMDVPSQKLNLKDSRNMRITTFTCPTPVIPKLKALYTEDFTRTNCSYIKGSAAIQEMRPHMRNDRIPEFMSILKKIVIDSLGYDAKTMYEISKLIGFSSRARLKRNTLYLTDIGNGDEDAAALIDAGEKPIINKMTLAGLVYMPPSINRDILQFRVRIKRPEIDYDIPKDYTAETGYDYVNVIVSGKEHAEEMYLKVKQGHPVYVEGTVEPTKFWTTVKPKNLTEVSEILGVDYHSIYIDRIKQFFFPPNPKARPSMVLPVVNIWADEIVTQKEKILEKAQNFADLR